MDILMVSTFQYLRMSCYSPRFFDGQKQKQAVSVAETNDLHENAFIPALSNSLIWQVKTSQQDNNPQHELITFDIMMRHTVRTHSTWLFLTNPLYKHLSCIAARPAGRNGNRANSKASIGNPSSYDQQPCWIVDCVAMPQHCKNDAKFCKGPYSKIFQRVRNKERRAWRTANACYWQAFLKSTTTAKPRRQDVAEPVGNQMKSTLLWLARYSQTA